MTHPVLRRGGLGLAIGIAGAALAWGIGLSPFMQTVEQKTYDLRVRALTDVSLADQHIVIVNIDDASVRKLEPLVGRWPWPRLVHATVIDFLSRAPARVVAYDILFGERDRRTFTVQGEPWTGEESDRALAEAVARSGNVVVATDVTASDPLNAAGEAVVSEAIDKAAVPTSPLFESRPGLMPPFPELAAGAAGMGHTLLVLDPDGPARRAIPAVRAGGRAIPSLALATALRAMSVAPSTVRLEAGTLRVGSARVPLVPASIPDADGAFSEAARMLIRFTGPAVLAGGRTTYREYSFYDLFYSEMLLQAGQKPFVRPDVFKNAVVLVGTTAAGLHDVFTVPFTSGKMPGVQVHANVVDNLLTQRFMRLAPRLANVGLAVVSAIVVGIVVLTLGVWWGVGIAVLVTVGIGLVAASSFGSGIWIDVARPLTGVALCLFGTTAYQYFVEGREKRQVKRMFSRFVSRDVFDQLMADPSRASLGGLRRDMSVLFSDIRGFTSLTERGRAEDVVAQLNEYFSTMVPVVLANRGTVDKFVGDMIMALFGAPLDDDDHPDHAVETAMAMLAALDRLNAQWAASGRETLAIGVGINSGDMIAGNIGSESIMSYTVIGDAVNLASRLESLNKQYGTQIIISEATRRRLKRRYDMDPLGDVVVKGKSEPVRMFGIRPSNPPSQDQP
jgi:adenylate cyclase